MELFAIDNMDATEAMDAVVSQIAKQFKKDYLVICPGNAPEEILRDNITSTGCLALDNALGTGGFPTPDGKLIMVWGPEKSGKSTLSFLHAAELQRQDKEAIVLYVDMEDNYCGRYAKILGVDTDRLLLSMPSCGEEAIDVVEAVFTNPNVKLAIIDSIPDLTPQAQLARDSSEGARMCYLAAFMSDVAIPKLKRVCKADRYNRKSIILINQQRDNPNVRYGSTAKAPGGNRLRHDVHVRVYLRATNSKARRVFADNDTDEIQYKSTINEKNCYICGYEVDGHIEKSKKSSAGAKQEQFTFRMIADEGIDKVYDVLYTASDLGVISKRGSSYYDISTKDGINTIHGSQAVADYVKENYNMMRERIIHAMSDKFERELKI